MDLLAAIESRTPAKVARAIADDPKSVQEAKTALDETALHVAVKGGNARIVAMLLDAGAEVDAVHYRRQTPLHFASGLGLRIIVAALLDRGANASAVDAFARTPLHQLANGGGKASDADRIAIVQRLVEAGCPVDAKESSGRSALYFATSRGRLAVVEALLERGADPALTADGTQGSARDVARASKDAKLIALLDA